LFQACSISKPVAVFAVLRLVDQGVLDLDEDVNRRLTSWQIPQTGDWQPVVTLRQLVSHSAGLTVHGFPGYEYGEKLPTAREILDGVAPATNFGVRVDTVPGTQFRYSGGGTVVVQQLLEDVTGKPFRQLAQELVLRPLGMTDSDYAQPLPEDRHSQAAVAHEGACRPIKGRWHSYPELAAAGLWTTPSDLVTFAQVVKNSYDGVEGAPLSPELARELLTPQMPSSERIGGLDALGLGLFVTQDGLLFGHSGSNEGFRCHLIAYRDSGQGAAVMTNGDNGDFLVQKILVKIAAAYGWSDYPTELDKRTALDDEAMAGRVGTYRLRENLKFVVERAEVGILVTFDGQSPMPFRPMSPDRFGARTADTELRFDDGGVVFVQNGEEIRCTRE